MFKGVSMLEFILNSRTSKGIMMGVHYPTMMEKRRRYLAQKRILAGITRERRKPLNCNVLAAKNRAAAKEMRKTKVIKSSMKELQYFMSKEEQLSLLHEKWDDYVKWPIESKFQTYVIKRLEIDPEFADNVKIIKILKANINGVSDLLACISGRYCAIELKVRNNGTSPAQDKFFEDVKDAGGVAGEARSWREVRNLLREARDR